MLLLIYARLIQYESKAMTSHYQRDESWGQVRDKSQQIRGSRESNVSQRREMSKVGQGQDKKRRIIGKTRHNV